MTPNGQKPIRRVLILRYTTPQPSVVSRLLTWSMRLTGMALLVWIVYGTFLLVWH